MSGDLRVPPPTESPGKAPADVRAKAPANVPGGSVRTTRLHWGLLIVGSILVGLTAAMMAQGLVMAPADTLGACAFTKPILCAEFPTSGLNLEAVLSSAYNSHGAWSRTIWLDMPFLVAYAALLSMAGFRCCRVVESPKARRLARLTAGLAILGAAADTLENIGMLRALDLMDSGAGGLLIPNALAHWIGVAAATKFTLLGLSCVGIGVLAIRGRRRSRIWGVLWLAAGSLAGLSSLVGWFYPPAFALTGLGIAMICLLAWLSGFGLLVPPSIQQMR